MKQLTKEAYFLSKNLHVNYNDVMDMAPAERQYLISFLVEDFQRMKEQRDAQEAVRQDLKRR